MTKHLSFFFVNPPCCKNNLSLTFHQRPSSGDVTSGAAAKALVAVGCLLSRGFSHLAGADAAADRSPLSQDAHFLYWRHSSKALEHLMCPNFSLSLYSIELLLLTVFDGAMPPSLSTKYNKSSHHRVLFTLIKYLDLGELTILQTDDLRGNADERFLVIEFGEKQQQQSDGGRRRHGLHMWICVCVYFPHLTGQVVTEQVIQPVFFSSCWNFKIRSSR